MNNNAQGWLLFLMALPAVVVGYLWLLILCILPVVEWRSLRFQGAGVLTGQIRPKIAHKWGYSTTIGRAIVYHPSAYDETPEPENDIERHEFVHIKQWEDACTWGLLGGAAAAGVGCWMVDLTASQFFGAWMAIWCVSVAALATNYLTAVMRYGLKGIYRDTEHERSAYAQTDAIRQAGKGWDELRDEQRESQKGNLS